MNGKDDTISRVTELVKTFVIFDTETTGLPSPGCNPSITELCFVAVTREELLTEQRDIRVLNKLLVCFRPSKSIPYESSLVTGLYNDSLDALAPFNKQAPLITMFLRNLPQPACLIAHYGNGYDFPLLISHLKNSNEEVPEGILCADSLEAFRMFDGLPPVLNFVLQKRKEKKASTSMPETKILSTIDESFGHMFEGEKIFQAFGDTLNQKNHVNNHDGHKRPVEVCDGDKSCKQAKFSPQKTEVWDKCQGTPPNPSSEITSSFISKSSHFVEGSSGDINLTKRQLFPSSNENDKHRQDQISSLNQLSINKDTMWHYNTGSTSDTPTAVEHSSSFVRDFAVSNNSTGGCQQVSEKTRSEMSLCRSAVSDHGGSSNEIEVTKDGFTLIKEAGSSSLVQTYSNGKGNSAGSSCMSSLESEKCMSNSPNIVKPTGVSYSLQNLYKRVFGQETKVAHTAEADCLTLLELIRWKKSILPSWCDEHAVPLSSIDPMF